MEPLVSVIVATLDEEAMLPAALDRLALLPGNPEVIVADGGSRDATVAAAQRHPLRPRVIEASHGSPGRGAQLNAAAAAARGEVLLFLHADTRLPLSSTATVAAALADPKNIGGNFELRFDGGERFSDVLARLYRLLRRAGVYYGDSAIFVRADLFARLGGFRALPVLDDFDFVRRLERAGRTVCLPGPAVTSARRWRANGAAATLATWLAVQGLFLLGVPASRLASLYRAAR